MIEEPILGGSGQITGNFTTQTANNLAILLRAGALPAPLKILEERTVGAELGADSVKAGRYSAIAGLIMVAVFMILRYGLFGVFADIALTLNVVLLLAALTAFGATLTLPGIAGIVLTMGMAVDANVLIYERIREEQRNGRSMLASIDTGFRRAMATIIDANMTHLIASLILFELGSGPVKGFAVTLGVGIITSFFTAVMVTRLIVIAWLNIAQPRKLRYLIPLRPSHRKLCYEYLSSACLRTREDGGPRPRLSAPKFRDFRLETRINLLRLDDWEGLWPHFWEIFAAW